MTICQLNKKLAMNSYGLTVFNAVFFIFVYINNYKSYLPAGNKFYIIKYYIIMYFCTLYISIITELPLRYIKFIYVGIYVHQYGYDKA